MFVLLARNPRAIPRFLELHRAIRSSTVLLRGMRADLSKGKAEVSSCGRLGVTTLTRWIDALLFSRIPGGALTPSARRRLG